jgi:uncharacterized repeat protein (TIGR03803 family)
MEAGTLSNKPKPRGVALGASCTAWRLAARAVVALLIGCAPALSQSFDVVVDFGIPAGKEPHGGLVETSDGCLYGTTVAGGAGHGTLFRLCSGVSTTIFNFDGATTGRYPQGALTLGSDGQLYGTTRLGGGAPNAGTIFRLNPSNGTVTTLHTFNGANGAESVAELTEGDDGRLYGVTSMGGASNKGAVFSIQKSGAGFTLLKSFTGTNGRGPSGKLVQATDTFWYGTTAMGGTSDLGTIFRMSSTGTLTTLASFTGTNGANPYGGLIQATDGYLYGLSGGGGTASQGTFFRVTLDGDLRVLRSFTGSDGFFPYAELIQATDGLFYGTTMFGGGGYGVVFKINASGAITVLRSLLITDGARPDSALVQASNGKLYGTTPSNGPSGAAGTVFEVTATGAFTRVHVFSGEPSTPYAPLLARPDGSLFGISAEGGAAGSGTIFKLVPGISFEVLHGFSGPINGSSAWDGLTAAADGTLYGTAPKGGPGTVGTIFKIAATGTFTLLTAVPNTGSIGVYPYGSIVEGADGALYGAMIGGGASDAGTIYKMTTAGVTSLAHSFSAATHGSRPYGRLLAAADGVLYGTASGGGPNYKGTLYSYEPIARRFTLLHTFNGSDGGTPYAGLIEGSDGRLYGTTFAGGAYNYGTVFAFDVAARKLTTLHSFKASDGANPYAALIEAANGRLYGTTSGGGGSNLGTVFSIDRSGAGYTVMHSFKGTDGAAPRAALAQAADSFLYGTTSDGGSTNSGVIFRVSPSDGGELPAAPSNLSATAVSETRVNLAWTINSTDELEFRVERCTGASCSSFVEIGTAPARTATFADSTVASGNTYRYRVFAVNGAGASPYSNIASASTSGVAITVTAPNTAVNWAVGSVQKIRWTHNRGTGSTVRVEVSRDGGTTWTTIASSVTNGGATTGSYNWTVTSPVTGRARIRVQFTDGAAADTSNTDFTIAAPFVRVTAPNLSSVVLNVGTNTSIKWTSNLGPLERVKIELSKDGGATYTIVMVLSTPSDGAQSVLVPSSWVSPTAKVRIYWLKDVSIVDASDQAFIIQ